jgi:hypothetical protein
MSTMLLRNISSLQKLAITVSPVITMADVVSCPEGCLFRWWGSIFSAITLESPGKNNLPFLDVLGNDE